jgi:ferritin-like metal-binding protein YciE
VIVSGVTETEHHEIAVYEGLIESAEAMGEDRVVSLLEQNLHDEQAALERAQTMAHKLAAEAARAG